MRMATTILSSLDPSNLRDLNINYLQDEGFCNGRVMAQDVSGDTYESANSRRYRFPGPMAGILKPLIGKCTSLESVTLRKGGAYQNHLFHWSCINDRTLLKEWAAFLVGARTTLQSIVIGQADHDGNVSDEEEYVDEDDPPSRPMDRRFMRYIWPIFFENDFSSLRHVEIRGLGRDKTGRPTLTDETRADFLKTVKDGHVVLEEMEERGHCLYEGVDRENEERSFPPHHHWEFKADYLFDNLPQDPNNSSDYHDDYEGEEGDAGESEVD
jgi:hypothetical protein